MNEEEVNIESGDNSNLDADSGQLDVNSSDSDNSDDSIEYVNHSKIDDLNRNQIKTRTFVYSENATASEYQRALNKIILSTQEVQADPFTSIRRIANQAASFTNKAGQAGFVGSRFNASTVLNRVLRGVDNDPVAGSDLRGGFINRFILTAPGRNQALNERIHSQRQSNPFGPLTIAEQEYQKWLATLSNKSYNPAVEQEFKVYLARGKHGYSMHSSTKSLNALERIEEQVPVNLGKYTVTTSHGLNDHYNEPNARIVQPLPTMSQRLTGFVSRADTRDIGALLEAQGVFNATFFQFQNADIISKLITRQEGYNVATQNFDIDSYDVNNNNDKAADIFAGNELFLGVAKKQLEIANQILTGKLSATAATFVRKLEEQGVDPQKWANSHSNSSATGVRYKGSFHSKTGYIDRFAFIGSQNVTPAMSKKNSLESILIVDKNSTALESRLYTEIKTYTDVVLDIAKSKKDNEQVAFGEVHNKFKQALPGSQYLYTDKEILDRLTTAISGAAKLSKKDTVYISMGELSLLLQHIDLNSNDPITNRNAAMLGTFKEALSILAKEKRLHIATDSKKMSDILSGNIREGADTEFIRNLIQQGAVHSPPTTFQHDKSVAIFDDGNKLRFLSTGSANLSANSMLGTATNDGYTYNTEVVTAMGVGIYADLKRGTPVGEVEDYFGYLTAEKEDVYVLYKTPDGKPESVRQVRAKKDAEGNYIFDSSNTVITHFQTLAGVTNNDGTRLFNSGYRSERLSKYSSERKAQIANITQLKETLSSINPHIKTEFRYAIDSNIEDKTSPVGIRVTIAGPDPQHMISLDLAVTAEGNVVVSDLNKVLNASQFVNNTGNTVSITNLDGSKVEIKKGESKKLDSFQTTIGLVQTIQREFVFQQEHALVNQVFGQLALEEPHTLRRLIRDYTADKMSTIFPHLATDVDSNNTTLASFIENLYTRQDGPGREKFQEALTLLSRAIAENVDRTTLTPLDLSKRIKEVQSLVKILANFDSVSVARGFSTNFADLLMADSKGIYNDIKKQLIQQHELSSLRFREAAKSQSRAVVTELLSPFLAAHEETYSFYQGQTRLPVYGENTDFELIHGDSEYARILSGGILNPLPMTHATRIGEGAGSTYRPLAGTSTGGKLTLPGYGQLRQLTILDSDISTQAAVVHDMPLIAKSTPGMLALDKTDYLKSLQDLGIEVDKEVTEKVEALFKQGGFLYNLPYPSLEQITQRLKNVIGTRSTLDVNKDYVGNILSKLGASSEEFKKRRLTKKDHYDSFDESSDALSGKLRTVLSSAQFEDLQGTVKMLADSRGVSVSDIKYEEVLKYYREQQIDPLSVKRGFIGPESYRRIAINAGASQMGDFGYFNEADDTQYGAIHRVRIKIDPSQMEDVTSAREYVLSRIRKGTVAIGKSMELESDKILVVNGEERVVRSLDAGMYQFAEDGKIIRVGIQNDKGFIELDGISKLSESSLGTRRESVRLRTPAFSNREMGGISSVIDDANNVVSSRDTMIFEFDVLTTKIGTTGMRVVGYGNAKAPMMYMEEEFFKPIEKLFELRNHQELMPIQPNQRVYGMISFKNYKGFSYDKGLAILANQKARTILTKSSGMEIARALAVTFLGDKTVKKALADSLYTEGLYQAAASVTESNSKQDISKGASGVMLSGLQELMSAEERKASVGQIKGGLNPLKQLVIKALTGDSQALQDLQTRTQTLFSNIISKSHSIQSESGDTISIINETDTYNRGGGMLAHMLFYGRQMYSSSAQGKTIKGLNELPVNNIDLYIGTLESYTGSVEGLKGLDSYSYRTIVDGLAKEMGILLPSLSGDKEKDKDNIEVIRQKLNLLQSLFDTNFLLEDITDMSISQSLVPTGMEDTAKMEFQYLVGLSTKALNAYKRIGSESDESKSIQHAYVTLLGALQGDLFSGLVSSKGLDFSTVFFKGAFKHHPSGARAEDIALDERYLDMRRLAIFYTPDEQFKSEKAILPDYRLGIDEVLSGQRLPELNRLDSNRAVDRVIRSAYDRSSSAADDYLRGLEQIQYHAAKTENAELMRAVSKTKQIVIPKLNFQLDPNRGEFSVYASSFSEGGFKSGAILGLDILSHASLSFGDFKDEVLTTQIKLIELLGKAEPLLNKIANRKEGEALYFSEDEVMILQNLERTVDDSRASLLKLVNNEIMRQTFGDHMKFKGAVGIALNSFAMRPDEFLAGRRYSRFIREDRYQISKSFQQQIALFNKSSGNRFDIAKSGLESLYQAFGAGDLTPGRYDNTALASVANAKRVEMDYVFSQLDTLKSLSNSNYQSLSDSAKISSAQSVVDNIVAVRKATLEVQEQIDKNKGVYESSVYQEKYKELDDLRIKLLEDGASGKLKGLNDYTASILGQAHLYSSLLNVRKEDGTLDYENVLKMIIRDKEQKTQLVEEMLLLKSGGRVGRTGAPAAAAAEVTEKMMSSTGMTFDELVGRYEALQENNKHIISEYQTSYKLSRAKFDTGLFVPSYSRLLAGLGDYDGDSYQLLINAVGEKTKEFTEVQERIYKLIDVKESKLNILQNLATDLNIGTSEAAIKAHSVHKVIQGSNTTDGWVVFDNELNLPLLTLVEDARVIPGKPGKKITLGHPDERAKLFASVLELINETDPKLVPERLRIQLHERVQALNYNKSRKGLEQDKRLWKQIHKALLINNNMVKPTDPKIGNLEQQAKFREALAKQFVGFESSNLEDVSFLTYDKLVSDRYMIDPDTLISITANPSNLADGMLLGTETINLKGKSFDSFRHRQYVKKEILSYIYSNLNLNKRTIQSISKLVSADNESIRSVYEQYSIDSDYTNVKDTSSDDLSFIRSVVNLAGKTDKEKQEIRKSLNDLLKLHGYDGYAFKGWGSVNTSAQDESFYYKIPGTPATAVTNVDVGTNWHSSDWELVSAPVESEIVRQQTEAQEIYLNRQAQQEITSTLSPSVYNQKSPDSLSTMEAGLVRSLGTQPYSPNQVNPVTVGIFSTENVTLNNLINKDNVDPTSLSLTPLEQSLMQSLGPPDEFIQSLDSREAPEPTPKLEIVRLIKKEPDPVILTMSNVTVNDTPLSAEVSVFKIEQNKDGLYTQQNMNVEMSQQSTLNKNLIEPVGIPTIELKRSNKVYTTTQYTDDGPQSVAIRSISTGIDTIPTQVINYQENLGLDRATDDRNNFRAMPDINVERQEAVSIHYMYDDSDSRIQPHSVDKNLKASLDTAIQMRADLNEATQESINKELASEQTIIPTPSITPDEQTPTVEEPQSSVKRKKQRKPKPSPKLDDNIPEVENSSIKGLIKQYDIKSDEKLDEKSISEDDSSIVKASQENVPELKRPNYLANKESTNTLDSNLPEVIENINEDSLTNKLGQAIEQLVNKFKKPARKKRQKKEPPGALVVYKPQEAGALVVYKPQEAGALVVQELPEPSEYSRNVFRQARREQLQRQEQAKRDEFKATELARREKLDSNIPQSEQLNIPVESDKQSARQQEQIQFEDQRILATKESTLQEQQQLNNKRKYPSARKQEEAAASRLYTSSEIEPDILPTTKQMYDDSTQVVGSTLDTVIKAIEEASILKQQEAEQKRAARLARIEELKIKVAETRRIQAEEKARLDHIQELEQQKKLIEEQIRKNIEESKGILAQPEIPKQSITPDHETTAIVSRNIQTDPYTFFGIDPIEAELAGITRKQLEAYLPAKIDPGSISLGTPGNRSESQRLESDDPRELSKFLPNSTEDEAYNPTQSGLTKRKAIENIKKKIATSKKKREAKTAAAQKRANAGFEPVTQTTTEPEVEQTPKYTIVRPEIEEERLSQYPDEVTGKPNPIAVTEQAQKRFKAQQKSLRPMTPEAEASVLQTPGTNESKVKRQVAQPIPNTEDPDNTYYQKTLKPYKEKSKSGKVRGVLPLGSSQSPNLNRLDSVIAEEQRSRNIILSNRNTLNSVVEHFPELEESLRPTIDLLQQRQEQVSTPARILENVLSKIRTFKQKGKKYIEAKSKDMSEVESYLASEEMGHLKRKPLLLSGLLPKELNRKALTKLDRIQSNLNDLTALSASKAFSESDIIRDSLAKQVSLLESLQSRYTEVTTLPELITDQLQQIKQLQELRQVDKLSTEDRVINLMQRQLSLDTLKVIKDSTTATADTIGKQLLRNLGVSFDKTRSIKEQIRQTAQVAMNQFGLSFGEIDDDYKELAKLSNLYTQLDSVDRAYTELKQEEISYAAKQQKLLQKAYRSVARKGTAYNEPIVESLEQANAIIQEFKERKNIEYESEIDKEYAALQEIDNFIGENYKSLDRIGARMMEDQRRTLINYLKLPEHIFSGNNVFNDMRDGELYTLLKQKMDIAAGSDTQKHIDSAEIQTTIFGELFNQNLISVDMQENNNINLYIDEYRKGGTDRDKSIEDIYNLIKQTTASEPLEDRDIRIQAAGLLEFLDTRAAAITEHNIQPLLQEYAAATINRSMAIEGVNDTLKKAQGAVLNPFEFDSSIQVVGLGGSSLIGEAYNTLIPLLEKAAISHTLIYSASTSESFGKALTGLGLGHLVGEASMKNINQEYYGTIGLLQDMQQVVRDALKAKAGSTSIQDLFNKVQYKNMTLGEYLSATAEMIAEKNPKDAVMDSELLNKEKLRVLSSFLQSKMGPQIDSNTFLDSNVLMDHGLTGFGALTLLSEYTTTPDVNSQGEGLYQKFINPDPLYGDRKGLRDSYDKWLIKNYGEKSQRTVVATDNTLVKQFLGETIIDLLQKTQASFSASVMAGGEAEVDIISRHLAHVIRAADGDSSVEPYRLAVMRYIEVVNQQLDTRHQIYVDQLKGMTDKNIIRSLHSSITAVQDLKDTAGIDAEFNKRLIAEMKLTALKLDPHSLNLDTLEYLREHGLAKVILNASKDDESMTSKASRTNLALFNELIRRMRRGKTVTPEEALMLASFKLSNVRDNLEGYGLTPEEYQKMIGAASLGEITTTVQSLGLDTTTARSLISRISQNQMGVDDGFVRATKNMINDLVIPEEQKNILHGLNVKPDRENVKAEQALLMATFIESLSISDEDKKKFIVGLHQPDAEGKTLLDRMTDSSAALLKTFQIQSQLDALESQTTDIPNQAIEDRKKFLSNILENVWSNGKFNTDALQRMGLDVWSKEFNGASIEGQADLLESLIRQRPPTIRREVQREEQRYRAMRSAEVIGALISPLLFAMAGDGVQLDARFGMFALDIVQSVAVVSQNQASFTNKYLTESERFKRLMGKSTNVAFDRARIRQSIQTEGAVAGIIQGVGQELIFRGVSQMLQEGINSTVRRLTRGSNPSGVAASGTILSEVLTTVFSLGFSRAMSKARGVRGGVLAVDPMTRMINAYIEASWVSADTALMNLLEQSHEILDTDFNNYIDFDTTAFPSDIEWDIESGTVVLDGDGIHVHADANDTDYESMMSIDNLVT